MPTEEHWELERRVEEGSVSAVGDEGSQAAHCALCSGRLPADDLRHALLMDRAQRRV